MALSNWFCTNSTKNMLVKIVHPGGHVELHDRPVLAAEIILRNPRCCVAHPNVFKQPWAIVSPDTTLMPGQKFYVVPLGTIRKLQKLSFKNSPSLLVQESTQTSSQNHNTEGEVESKISPNKNSGRGSAVKSLDYNCCACLLTVIKVKASTKDSNEETRSSSCTRRKRTNDGSKREGSPKRRSSFDQWQPSLESIKE